MKKDEVRGVSVKRKKPIVIPVEDDPENQFISKEEFLRKRAIQKKAKAAAQEAQDKILNEAGLNKKTQVPPKLSQAEEKVSLLRKQLANAEKKLQENPESKSWQVKVKSLSEELEVAESESI